MPDQKMISEKLALKVKKNNSKKFVYSIDIVYIDGFLRQSLI